MYMLCADTNTLAWTPKGLQTDAPMDRDLTAQVYGRQQILAAPRLYPSTASRGLGCEAELSSGEAAGAGGSILPSWCIQTLCSSLIPPLYSPMSLLHSHWSSTRLQDNKVTTHLNQIHTWNCSYLNCSPPWNAICYKDRKKFLKYPSSHQFIRLSELMLVTKYIECI